MASEGAGGSAHVGPGQRGRERWNGGGEPSCAQSSVRRLPRRRQGPEAGSRPRYPRCHVPTSCRPGSRGRKRPAAAPAAGVESGAVPWRPALQEQSLSPLTSCPPCGATGGSLLPSPSPRPSPLLPSLPPFLTHRDLDSAFSFFSPKKVYFSGRF